MPGVVAMRDKFAADGVTKTKDEMLAYIKGEIEANRVNHAELQIDTWKNMQTSREHSWARNTI